MGTNTDLRGLSPRTLHRQAVHTMRKTVNFGDAGIGGSAGILLSSDALPLGAFITSVWVEIVTAFNAGTTNLLTVGTNGAVNNIVSSADLTGNNTANLSAQVTEVLRAAGRSLAAAADVQVSVKYVQTGAAATTGQAVIVIEYEANYPG